MGTNTCAGYMIVMYMEVNG